MRVGVRVSYLTTLLLPPACPPRPPSPVASTCRIERLAAAVAAFQGEGEGEGEDEGEGEGEDDGEGEGEG